MGIKTCSRRKQTQKRNWKHCSREKHTETGNLRFLAQETLRQNTVDVLGDQQKKNHTTSVNSSHPPSHSLTHHTLARILQPVSLAHSAVEAEADRRRRWTKEEREKVLSWPATTAGTHPRCPCVLGTTSITSLWASAQRFRITSAPLGVGP
jgi:hypothetical protein